VFKGEGLGFEGGVGYTQPFVQFSRIKLFNMVACVRIVTRFRDVLEWLVTFCLQYAEFDWPREITFP